ncbi:MAG TPA: hypothetical protein VN841_23610 [Bryobacteraceae bacterium]|nr:hypothetical protein [Bryobacteraceae bacterium]
MHLFKVVRSRLSPPSFSSVLIGLERGLRTGEVVFIAKKLDRSLQPPLDDWEHSSPGKGQFFAAMNVLRALRHLPLNDRSMYEALLGVIGAQEGNAPGRDPLRDFRGAIASAHEEADPRYERSTEQLARILEALEDGNLKPAGKLVFRMLANLLRDLRLIPDRNTEGAGVRKE